MPQYIIPVNYDEFRPTQFHSQWVGTEEQGVGSCYLIVTRVPPGTGTGSVHTHTGDQFYFIFDGDMNLRLGDQHHTATAGDLIFIPCAVPHRNWNTTDKDEIHFEFIVPNAQPNLARAYRGTFDVANIAEDQLIPTKDPHYVRSLDYTKFDPKKTSSVTMADYSTGSHHARIDIMKWLADGEGREMRVKGYDDIYYTIDGSLQAMIGKERHTVPEHSYLYIPAGTPHAVWNEGAPANVIHCLVPEPRVIEPDIKIAWES
jgi:quercetin dioxygenase-like cupin family protein